MHGNHCNISSFSSEIVDLQQVLICLICEKYHSASALVITYRVQAMTRGLWMFEVRHVLEQKVVWKLLMCWLPEWFPLFDLPHFIIFCLPTQRSSPVLDIFQKHFLGNFSPILYTHVTNCRLVSSIIIGRVLVCWARVRGFKPSRTKTSVSLTNWVIKHCLCNDIC